ncbi:hypothetical protein ACFX2B_008645 [Malus domestica]|uniref:MATH domain-containing protein n=1 Tax=Malus domestica TaxID=3750 RepID=A0A498IIG7_MALDO|nr:hypothetical protein DVH24_005195 [Malus domestica]
MVFGVLVDAQLEDLTSMKFTWEIDNFTTLNTRNFYSDIFVAGGYKWRILIFPKGSNNVGWFSMYLDAADSGTLPDGWSRYFQLSLAVVNQIHSKDSVTKETHHQFCTTEIDLGFTCFMPLIELYDPSRGYLVNDTVFICLYV